MKTSIIPLILFFPFLTVAQNTEPYFQQNEALEKLVKPRDLFSHSPIQDSIVLDSIITTNYDSGAPSSVTKILYEYDEDLRIIVKNDYRFDQLNQAPYLAFSTQNNYPSSNRLVSTIKRSNNSMDTLINDSRITTQYTADGKFLSSETEYYNVDEKMWKPRSKYVVVNRDTLEELRIDSTWRSSIQAYMATSTVEITFLINGGNRTVVSEYNADSARFIPDILLLTERYANGFTRKNAVAFWSTPSERWDTSSISCIFLDVPNKHNYAITKINVNGNLILFDSTLFKLNASGFSLADTVHILNSTRDSILLTRLTNYEYLADGDNRLKKVSSFIFGADGVSTTLDYISEYFYSTRTIVSNIEIDHQAYHLQYANPSDRIELLVSGPDVPTQLKLQLVDQSGRTISEHPLQINESLQIDRSYLPAGLYYLSLYDGQRRHTEKLILK